MKPAQSTEYGIVLLAAGTSSRLGRPKQLLPFHGSSLIKRAATVALQISQKVVVVTGAEADKLEEVLSGLPLQMIHNYLSKEGIASSVRIGISGLVTTYGQTAGAIFIVCDQPYLQAGLLQDLVDKAHQTNKGIVASAYGGTFGIPVLFQQKYFDRLTDLKGDIGAKKLIHDNLEDAAFVDFPLGNVDIDTIEDYKAIIENE